MEIVPGPATATALILATGFAPLIVVLSHRPFRIADLRKRLLVGIAITDIIGVFAVVAFAIVGTALAWSDMIAGALVLVTAQWAFAVFWSLICWGFTLSLLQALKRLDRPAHVESWVREYAGSGGVDSLTRDRFSVLQKLKLVDENETSKLNVTPRGKAIAAIAHVLRFYYGLHRG